MVRFKNTLYKPAFTMIELIFAIVIIAISVMSLPMVSQVTAKGVENSFAQEAIFGASAELNHVLSYKWDVNSKTNLAELSKVLSMTGTDECNTTNNGVQRLGHIHRMCIDTLTTPLISSVGSDSIDGQRTASDLNLTEAGTITDGSGYKDNYTMDINVSFANFGTATAVNKNMKQVVITVKKANAPYVELRTFSANIGEVEVAKRIF